MTNECDNDNKDNKDNKSTSQKTYYQKNKDRLKAYTSEYRSKNRDRVNAYRMNHYWRNKAKTTEISHLTESQRTIFFNLRRINKMKNNGKTWAEIALTIGMHRDTLMRALRAGVFDYEKKYILKLKELKQ